jgi:cytochrome c oxidase subunit 2
MGNYTWLLPVQASDFAPAIDRGLWIIHIAMALIFVVWSIFFVYLLVRYRQRDGHKAQRDHLRWRSLAPDIAVLFEVLLVVIYAVPSWRMKVEVPRRGFLQVEWPPSSSTGTSVPPDGKFGAGNPIHRLHQPLWDDPADAAGKDDVVTVNELRFPLDERVLVRLTSKDVIHSFFIPEFRVKQDAVPGLAIPVWFTPTRAGDYEITYLRRRPRHHARRLKVQPRAELDEWLKGKKTATLAAAPKAAVEQW